MQDYKPQFMHWKLILLARKLVFACVVVLLNHVVEAQVGIACIGVDLYDPAVTELTVSRAVLLLRCIFDPGFFTTGGQASLSVTIILTAYILQQRCAPFVAVSAISGKLGLTADNLTQQLQAIEVQKTNSVAATGASSRHLGGQPTHDTALEAGVATTKKSSRRTASSRALLPPAVTAVGGDDDDDRVSVKSLSESAGVPGPLLHRPVGGGSSEPHLPERQQSNLAVTPLSAPVTVWTPKDANGIGRRRGNGTAHDSESVPAAAPLHGGALSKRLSAVGVAARRGQLAVLLRQGAGCAVSCVVRSLRWLLTTAKATVYTGIINYNHLETAFLIASIVILILGMVFTSQGFTPGSTGYNILTAVAVVIIVTSTSVFVSLLTFEVYRSLKFSELNDVARQLEVDHIEQALIQSRSRGRAKAGDDSTRGTRHRDSPSRRRSSLMAKVDVVRRRFSRLKPDSDGGRYPVVPSADADRDVAGAAGSDGHGDAPSRRRPSRGGDGGGNSRAARRKSSVLEGLNAMVRRRFTRTALALPVSASDDQGVRAVEVEFASSNTTPIGGFGDDPRASDRTQRVKSMRG